MLACYGQLVMDLELTMKCDRSEFVAAAQVGGAAAAAQRNHRFERAYLETETTADAL